MASHSDSEIIEIQPNHKLSSNQEAKHKLSFLDQIEPKQSTKSSKQINFTISMSPFDVIQGDSDESDDTWYPPQHPISKKQNFKRKQKPRNKKRKPKEERWSYWKKQLPSDIEYCEEEIKYFMEQPLEHRRLLMKEENKIESFGKKKEPPRFRFLQDKTMKDSIKQFILQRIDSWYALEPSSDEHAKLGNWMNALSKLPFSQFAPTLRDNLQDKKWSISKCLRNAKETMDKAVYCHEEAKEQILELLAKEYSNPNGSNGFCIGIQGPAGNGKTTLIKEGICKAIGRPFQLIALGGTKDSSSFIGHDYTYVGGRQGRIVQALQLAGVMNPVLYFDELDKISSGPDGDEIFNLLCHITDPSQNKLFEDKYFAGIPIDLSNVIFIFSFNDESKINPILKDRIQIIRTEGLSKKQKIYIVRHYILPEVKEELPEVEIKIEDDVISHIIEHHTGKEKGVRNLKRAVYTICRKINLHKMLMVDPDTKSEMKMYTKIKKKEIESHTISKETADELLKTSVKRNDGPPIGMYS